MPNPEPEDAASEPPETPASAPEASAPDDAAPAAALEDRSRRRPHLLIAAAIVGGILAVVGVGKAVLSARGSDKAEPNLKFVAPAYRELAASLPWPHEGETALWAQGIGDLGTCGAQKPVPIASVAKVMTAFVVLRDHPLADGQNGPDITVDRQAEDESYAAEESTAPVRAGQRLSERALLELMLVPSANNVARLLARWDAGTQAAFVAEMNAAAAELGMTNTSYTDPSGFDPATRSTATDQLRLAQSALTDHTLLALTGVPETEVPDDPTLLTNTDALLGTAGVLGGKTGSSTPAGGALMWAANRPLGGADHLVLGVVLHQNPGTSAEQGLRSALLASQRLVDAMG